ncbi:MAG: hypothetical protein R3F13_00315 [Prosthecobacter sp.]
MNTQNSNDYPGPGAAMRAMRRAAEMARDIAIQTNTGIVIQVNGKLTRVSSQELLKTAQRTRQRQVHD